MDYEYNCATSPNQRCAGLYLMDTAALPFFRKGALSGEIKLRHEMVVCKTPPEGDRVRVERYVVLCMQSTQNLKREARKPGNLLSVRFISPRLVCCTGTAERMFPQVSKKKSLPC